MAKLGKEMKSVKGPGIFLAQFVDNKAPFNTLEGMCKWASDLGYKGIQIPTWESFLIAVSYTHLTLPTKRIV